MSADKLELNLKKAKQSLRRTSRSLRVTRITRNTCLNEEFTGAYPFIKRDEYYYSVTLRSLNRSIRKLQLTVKHK